MSTDYDQQLAAWKARHGLDPAADTNPDELRMAAEEAKSKAKAWCFGCDRQMPVPEMKLITRRLDPYCQTDEGETDYLAPTNRVRMCPACFEERYGAGGAEEKK